ncbi:hypothetical protein D3C78_1339510 [compost metagenome]
MQETLQRHQQALLIVPGQALLPQGVELIEHVQISLIFVDPIEHLNAVRLARWQEQCEVVVFQCLRIEVQRAVARHFFAQVIDQCRQSGQRDVLDLARHQLQHVVVLLDLDQVAMIEPAQQQVLRGIEDFLDPLGNELRAVMAEATHPQLRLLRPGRQVVEVVADAVEQGVGAVVAADQHFVPAIERDLVQSQHQIFPDTGVAQ